MILRNFLFLNTATTEDYLAALEGYTLEGPIEQTEAETKGGEVGVDKIIKAGKASGASTETKRRLAVTDASQFQRLYEILEEQELVQFLEAFDEEIWGQIHKGEILEIEANIRLPQSFELTQTIENFSPLLDIMTVLDQDPLSDPKTKMAFDGIRAVSKLSESKPIPLLFHADPEGFSFVGYLPRKFLRCEPSELQGEATVFGKVQRILPKGKSLEVFSLLPDLSNLPNMNREKRRKMQRDMSKQGLSEVVKGPAIIIDILAIYR
jgi:hypothetical protein